MPDIFVANKEGKKTFRKIELPKNHVENPREIFFANKKENEKIILFLRGHIVTNFPWIIVSLFLIIFPLLRFPSPHQNIL